MTITREMLGDDLVMDVDGYWYYWPETSKGSLAAHHLREIATILDDMNAEWDADVRAWLDASDNGQFTTTEDNDADVT